ILQVVTGLHREPAHRGVVPEIDLFEQESGPPALRHPTPPSSLALPTTESCTSQCRPTQLSKPSVFRKSSCSSSHGTRSGQKAWRSAGMERERVRRGVYTDRLHAERRRGARDADGDFTSVGNQYT